jgi:hypothetical protein
VITPGNSTPRARNALSVEEISILLVFYMIVGTASNVRSLL